MTRSWVLCVVVAVLLAACARAQQDTISDPCESLTKIRGCIECKAGRGDQSPPGALYRCLYCNKDRAQQWSTDTYFDSKLATDVTYITGCPAARNDPAKCPQLTGIQNCWQCWVGPDAPPGPWWSGKPWCTLCKLGYYFDWNENSRTFGQCLPGDCAQYTRNPGCTKCNPDKTCTACAGGNLQGPNKKFLMPKTAVFTNGAYGESMCVTYDKLLRYSKQVSNGNLPPPLPSNCTEVGVDMQCQRCVDGQTLNTPSSCMPNDSFFGNRCDERVPYSQYCVLCKEGFPRICEECVYSRTINDGKCMNNCKALWGIGCKSCTRFACTEIDPNYRFGRR